MSAQSSNPLGFSRRGFLQKTAGYAAGALAVSGAGCQSKTSSGVPRMTNVLEKKHEMPIAEPCEMPQISGAEGNFAVDKYLKDVLHADQPGNHLGDRPDKVHGVQLAATGTDPDKVILEVIFNEGEGPNLKNDRFHYTFNDGKNPVQKDRKVVKRKLPIPQPHIRIGQTAKGAGMPNNGTVGWHVRLNNMTVVLSAAHALLPTFNQAITPPISVTLNGMFNLANVSYYQPMAPPPNDNIWDLAAAQYVTESNAEKLQIDCNSGCYINTKPYGYPMVMASSVITGQKFSRIGAGGTSCGESLLNAVGAARTINNFMGQSSILFKHLLVFDASFAGPGDSGAIVARLGDWAAAGMHLGGTTGVETFSTALYELMITGGWTQGADYNIGGTPRMIPSFTGPSLP